MGWGGSAGEACLAEGGPQAAGSHQPRPWLLPSPGLSVPSLPRAFGLPSVHCILPSPPWKSPHADRTASEAHKNVLFFVWLGGYLAVPSPPPLPTDRQPHNSAPRSKQGLPLEVTDVERILPRVPPNSPGFSTSFKTSEASPHHTALAGGPGTRNPGGEWWASGLQRPGPGLHTVWYRLLALQKGTDDTSHGLGLVQVDVVGARDFDVLVPLVGAGMVGECGPSAVLGPSQGLLPPRGSKGSPMVNHGAGTDPQLSSHMLIKSEPDSESERPDLEMGGMSGFLGHSGL